MVLALVVEEPPAGGVLVVREQPRAVARLLAVGAAAEGVGEAALQVDRDEARRLPTRQLAAGVPSSMLVM